MASKKKPVVLSGPGVDKAFDLPQVALSGAITAACAARVESTFYVWLNDKAYGNATRDAEGIVTITRVGG